ncbi:MAG: DUF3592 domain-containing protein [Panacagrimonas sp.]
MTRKTHPMENLLLVAILVIGLGLGLGPVLWKQMRNQRILDSGRPTTARIVELIDTRRKHNQEPVLTIRLLVAGPDGASYPAEVTGPVSSLEIQRLKAGAVVTVRYDPKNPERVAIDKGAVP